MELTTHSCMIRNMKMEDTDDLYQVLSDTEMRMVICHKLQVEFGTRLISIIIAAKEMGTESCGLMMV